MMGRCGNDLIPDPRRCSPPRPGDSVEVRRLAVPKGMCRLLPEFGLGTASLAPRMAAGRSRNRCVAAPYSRVREAADSRICWQATPGRLSTARFRFWDLFGL